MIWKQTIYTSRVVGSGICKQLGLVGAQPLIVKSKTWIIFKVEF